MGERYRLQTGDALVAVDMQNCFLPGGKLGIAGSNRIIAPINRMIRIFERKGLPIAFSRDWHPPDHISFQEQGGPWTAHGVAGTADAAFSPELIMPATAVIFSKATDKTREEYSAFHAKSDSGLTLQTWLEQSNAKRVWIGGLATDYCVLNTALDLRNAGYAVVVLTDAVYAVNVHPGDGDRALANMTARGAEMVKSDEVEA